MKSINAFLIISLTVLMIGCHQSQKKGSLVSSASDVALLISSNEPDSIVKGYYLIGENKMMQYLPELFKNADDPRISHNINFKGMSVYQSKMSALKKMSGLDPPRKITYKPDSIVIDFYYRWALTEGYFK